MLCTLLLLGFNQSHAASVNWLVGPVSIQLVSTNFVVTRFVATLKCTFADDTTTLTFYGTHELAVQVKQVPTSSFQGAYILNMAPGTLKQSQAGADLKSCAYILRVEEKTGMSRNIELAGSSLSMPPAELQMLVTDTKLGQKISQKYKPLKLALQSGAISITQ